jgi:hypothetical protein
MSATKTVPWPSAEDLRRADEQAAAANNALDRLRATCREQYRAYMAGDGKPAPLSVEEYGRLLLYLESMELSVDSAMSSIKSMRENLDEVVWEVVDLEKAGIDA